MATGTIKARSLQSVTATNVNLYDGSAIAITDGNTVLMRIAGRLPAIAAWATSELVTLPVGYRPSVYVYSSVQSTSGLTFMIEIASSGVVSVLGSATAAAADTYVRGSCMYFAA